MSKTITQLDVDETLTGVEEIPIFQDGKTSKTTAQKIANLASFGTVVDKEFTAVVNSTNWVYTNSRYRVIFDHNRNRSVIPAVYKFISGTQYEIIHCDIKQITSLQACIEVPLLADIFTGKIIIN